MKVTYLNSIEYKALKRLKSIRSTVVLRKDFDGLGSYRQISRILKNFILQRKLVKIGSGLYAKAYISEYTNTPLIKDGTRPTLRQALKRLGIAYESGSAEKEYNEGKTTQVPVKNIVRLKSRCRRRIGYLKSKLIFERNINAK